MSRFKIGDNVRIQRYEREHDYEEGILGEDFIHPDTFVKQYEVLAIEYMEHFDEEEDTVIIKIMFNRDTWWFRESDLLEGLTIRIGGE